MQKIIQKILDLIPLGLRKRIKDLPLIKQLQAFIMKRYLDGKEFNAVISDGPAKGLQFPVRLPQDKLMWIGTWELDFATALKNYVKPGWVCFDIGGYKGYYAGIMALKGASEVIVFEPMPDNAGKIEKLIELNPGLPIHLKQVAIADKNGTALFKIMEEETMGKLETSSFQTADDTISEVEVNCCTIDELIKSGVSEPDFIKIDVEGAEEFVLKGASELLQRKKPFLMIEIHSPAIGERCIALLARNYKNITVLETGKCQDNGASEICHYVAHN